MPVEPSPGDVVDDCPTTYVGPFALDFAYEEWATAYRSSLQSSYLQVIEKSILADIESGHFERGIVIARRALDVCPDADNVELSLVRLYKLSGSTPPPQSNTRTTPPGCEKPIGVEPPSLDSL